jgi:hypothetical protein
LQVFRADVAKVDRGVSVLQHEGGMEDVAEPWGLHFRCCMKRFEMFHLVISDVARSDLRCLHPVLFDVA